MDLRVLLAVAALCTGCFGGTGHRTAPPRPDPHLGVAAAFPRSWSIVWRPCPECVEPRGVFVAASYPLAGGLRRMMCNRIPEGAVLVSLSEVRPAVFGEEAPSATDFPPRPPSFRLRPLRRLGVMESCAQPRAHLLRFRDSGRVLYAWAMFGPHPAHAIVQAQAVLDSLTVTPLHGAG
jgi:hypothetical protein